ncbi:copper chaperone PCu(A)C [Methylopila henanensis]|uniref:Copper chaperone PCu(A)C n=1 Tax=Methylopila henanensis TaxID=873516 RepID=A0ABW4KBW6_9HYPH
MLKLTLRAAAAAAFAAFALPAPAHEFKSGSIEIDHPWSRATPSGARVAGGYLVIRNGGDAPDRLIGAKADVAGRVEIHEMTVKDGVMTMRPLPEGVEAPAHGEVALKPGGLHLMLHELKRPLAQGETFAGALTFEKAGEIKVEFVVEALGARGPEAKAGEHAH